MKIFIRFCCLFLLILFMVVLSACARDVTTNDQTIPPVQSENNASSNPIASAVSTNAVPATAVTTLGSTELQPVPKVTDTSGSSDPYPLPFIKPADSDTPAAGICGNGAGEIVQIKLGAGPDGLPLGGRCVQVTPLQRIELTNPTFESLHVTFSVFDVEVPSGGVVLLDKPVGEYLAPGVHFLPNGPELWLKPIDVVSVATMPGPLRNYSNSEVGYSLTLPSNWNADEHGLSASTGKEVIFYPGNSEPFVVYLSVLLDFRSMDQIINFYAQNVPDAVRSDTVFNGLQAVQYTYSYGRIEYYIPYSDRIFLVITDKPSDGEVQLVLRSMRFMPATLVRYTNQELGYSLAYPPGWVVDETELPDPHRKLVRFYPPNGNLTTYLDIGLTDLDLETLRAQNPPNLASKTDIYYAGENGVQFMFLGGRSDIYLSHQGRVYYLYTDLPTDENVQKMIGSFVFIQ